MTPSNLTGEMLRMWRNRIGLSQNEAAERLGIAEVSLRNYEKQRRPDRKDPVQIPMLLDWALSALDAGLKPYSEKNESL